MFRLHIPLASTLALLTVACGGSSRSEPAPGQEAPSDSPADIAGDDGGTSSSPFRTGVADPCASPLDTGYLNDELCLAPPPADMGFQLHFGPDDAADYDDPEALAPFVLGPGEENTVCQYRHTPNDSTRFAMEQHIRVRSGTHHLLVWGAPSEQADRSAPADGSLLVADNCGANDGYQFQSGLQGALGPGGGTLDIPSPGGQVAEEDLGMARLVRPHASVVLEMHYVNTTSEPVLRESWVNTIYTPAESVTAVVDPIMFLGGLGMDVPPQSTQVVGAGPCEIPADAEELRIIGMNGHGHAHMTRLSAWIDRADGTHQPIYDTFDWSEPMVAQFNSVTDNPALGQALTDGAYSGVLTMGAGDRFSWECEVLNDLDTSIQWANEAYTAEMCNLFGYYTRGDSAQSYGNWVCVTP